MEQNRIMIVDDNPIDQMITAHILKTNYFKPDIIVMPSALAALDYLSANQDDPIAMPSLILLDLDMPEMNGFGFLEIFRNYADAIKNACRIIVLTGSDIEADLEQMKADPYVTQLLMKPLDRTALIPIV